MLLSLFGTAASPVLLRQLQAAAVCLQTGIISGVGVFKQQQGMATAAAAQQRNVQEEVLTEGRARIIKQGNDVFYNEAQVTNRDLSVAVLRKFIPQLARELADGTLKRKLKTLPPKQEGGHHQHGPGARILEGLSASGLRSIRYALEVDGVSRVDANDLDPVVVEAMKRNIALNGPEVQAKVQTHNSDVRLLMMQNPYTYDALDLDPYGTPAHLLDSAVQAVSEGGLLAVTATDMAVLCGNSGEVCWTKYGCYPVHRPYCHEGAVRIVLSCLEAHANRHKRYIVPLLAVHMDFYIRVFVRVYTSASEIKLSASKQSYVFQSQGCDSWWLQPVGQVIDKGTFTKFMPANGPGVPSMRCPESGAGYLMGGPIWNQPMHDQQWVQELLHEMGAEADRYAQHARLRGILTAVVEELPDVPLYYNIHDMCKTVHCTPPKMETIRSGIINAGYRVSGSHANPLALKTDAPPQVVWDLIRCWIKQHPVKDPDPQSYAAAILRKEVQTEANFKRAAGAVPQSSKQGVPRFVQNPAYWGPKARHGRPLKAEQQRQHEFYAEQRRSGQGGASAAAAAAAAGGGASNGNGVLQQQQQSHAETAAQATAQAAAQLGADWEDELDNLYDAAEGGGSSSSRAAKRPRQQEQQPTAAAGAPNS